MGETEVPVLAESQSFWQPAPLETRMTGNGGCYERNVTTGVKADADIMLRGGMKEVERMRKGAELGGQRKSRVAQERARKSGDMVCPCLYLSVGNVGLCLSRLDVRVRRCEQAGRPLRANWGKKGWWTLTGTVEARERKAVQASHPLFHFAID